MKKTILIAVLGAGLVASTPYHSAAHAQIAKQGTGYLFRMKYTAGSTINYSMSTKMTMNGQAAGQPITGKVKQVTKSVKNGVAKMEVTASGMAGMQPQTSTIEVDSRGRVVSGQQQQMSVALPEKAIPVGGTWTGDLGGMMGGQGSGKAIYKLVGFKKVGSIDVAQVSVSMDVSMQGGMKMKGTGMVLMRTSDGSMHNMTLNATMNMPAQGKGQKPMNMVMNMTMSRS